MTNFLVMWDMYGLECLFNVTEWHKKVTWSTLKDEVIDTGPNIRTMILRATLNKQRRYEIYEFQADEGVTEESIRIAFRDNPQGIVELIRKQGFKVYSDYNVVEKQIIT